MSHGAEHQDPNLKILRSLGVEFFFLKKLKCKRYGHGRDRGRAGPGEAPGRRRIYRRRQIYSSIDPSRACAVGGVVHGSLHAWIDIDRCREALPVWYLVAESLGLGLVAYVPCSAQHTTNGAGALLFVLRVLWWDKT
jgi:hypothetical protein